MANKMKAQFDRLYKLRSSLKDQIGALQNQLAGVEMSIRTMEDVGATEIAATAGTAPRKRMRNVKDTVLRLVAGAGPEGLSAIEVVAKATEQGIALDRGSVSSLLSRLKKEGTLTYNGERYAVAMPSGGTVTPLKSVHK